MPHSGGGGSHSGGGHSSSHSGGGGSHSSGPRISEKPFSGSKPYVIYNSRTRTYKKIYTDSSHYDATIKKGELISTICFLSIFILVGLIAVFSIVFESFSKPITAPYDTTIQIIDNQDLVSDEEEQLMIQEMENFFLKTGVVPCVEFTTEEYASDYYDLEAFAYNEYVVNFYDEKHFLLVYCYGDVNENTGFAEFNYETMWGDNTSRAIGSAREADFIKFAQAEFSRANGKNVPAAVVNTFAEFEKSLDSVKISIADLGPAIMVLLFFVGMPVLCIVLQIRKYKESKDLKTYKIDENINKLSQCEYCGNNYYTGIDLKCPGCGAPTKILKPERMDGYEDILREWT